jgi:hypothetical protein
LKSIVFLLFIASLVISLGYLPMVYHGVHSHIQAGLYDSVDALSLSDDISAPLDTLAQTHDQLESHDLSWLFIRTISGYANLLTLVVIGGTILIQRLFFKTIPMRKIAELVLPKFILDAIDKIIGSLGLQRSISPLATAKADKK